MIGLLALGTRVPLNYPLRWSTPIPIQAPLSQLRPLEFELVEGCPGARRVFAEYLHDHHYLGYQGPVGQNLQYLVRDTQDRHLGCVLFGAAAWKTQPRDQFIGWSPAQRERRVNWIVNNSRFLILPWLVRSPTFYFSNASSSQDA